MIYKGEDEDKNKTNNWGGNAAGKIVVEREFVFGVWNWEGAIIENDKSVEKNTKSKGVGEDAGNI